MADYRRCYVPCGSFFFTVVTKRRAGILANDLARDCLREAIRHCRQRLPFHVDALVILPDHIHAVWTMPQDDGDYSKRWGTIKKYFTQNWLASGESEQPVTESQLRYRRRGIWQKRFWGRARLPKPLRLSAFQSSQTRAGDQCVGLALFFVSSLDQAGRLYDALGIEN